MEIDMKNTLSDHYPALSSTILGQCPKHYPEPLSPEAPYKGALGEWDSARPVTLKSITEAVARRHGLTLADMVGREKARSFSIPRQEAMFEAWQVGHWTKPQIARFLRRDPSTVCLGVAAHGKRVGVAPRAPGDEGIIMDPIAAGIAGRIEQHIVKAMRDSPRWPSLPESERASLLLTADRIGRQLAQTQSRMTHPLKQESVAQ